MGENKSINELLSSIVSLINEAKNEYESVTNQDLPQKIYTEKERIQKKDKIKVEEKSNTIFKSKISSLEEKEVNRLNNWQNINFEKTIRKSNLKRFSNNISLLNNEKTEVDFRLLLDSWLKKNLNKLIEHEISNHIKNRQN